MSQPLRAVIYTRVSLDKTGEGEAVERQEEACRGLAMARGWHVVDVKRDNSISAYKEDIERPGWNDVLAMVKRGEVDVIIAWRLDRLTRSMTALEKLITITQEHNCAVATAQGDIDLTNETGRMVARILAAVARAEVEIKAARQRAANDKRADQGKPYGIGHRAFGYTQDGMHLIKAEANALRVAAQDVLNGASLAGIAQGFNDAGLLSVRASKGHSKGWGPSAIRQMLLNPRYAGIRVHRGVEVGTGKWPTIFDMDTHLALKALLSDPGRVRAQAGNQALLTGLVRCGKCNNGATLRVKQRDRYACGTTGSCVTVPTATLEQYVIDRIVGMLATPDIAEKLTPSDDERVNAARRENDALHKRLGLLRAQFDEGEFDEDPEGYRASTKRLRDQIKANKAIIAEASALTVFDGLDIGTPQVVAQWADLPLARQRAIIATLADITVRPAVGRGCKFVWTAEPHVQFVERFAAPVEAVA